MTNESLPRPINNLAARLLISLALRDASRYLARSYESYFDSRIMQFHLNDDHLDYNPAATDLLAALSTELEYIIFHDDTFALARIDELAADSDFIESISASLLKTSLSRKSLHCCLIIFCSSVNSSGIKIS